MFQLRGNDGRAYRPGRDIAFLFPDIARKAAYRLASLGCSHPAVKDYAEHTGMTPEMLSQATAALARFVNMTTNTDLTSGKSGDFFAAWVNAGLDKVPGPAIFTLMFELGFGVLATYFHCAREVTHAGQQAPQADAVSELLTRASHAASHDLPSARARAAEEARRAAAVSLGFDPETGRS